MLAIIRLLSRPLYGLKGGTMLIKLSVEQYLEEAASGKEVPGGGSVSALAGALGAAMASMAANFTAGKKKYAEFESEIQEILKKLAGCRSELSACVDADAQAFLGFNDVYAMPKDTDEQKAARDAKMQATLKAALQPPLRAMRQAVKALELLPRLAQIGNKNLISDVGVAAILLRAAVEGAWLNVRVNLRYIKEDAFTAPVAQECAEINQRAPQLAQKTLELVNAAI